MSVARKIKQEEESRIRGQSFLEQRANEKISNIRTTHNEVLDSDHHACKVGFLDLIDDNHLLKKMSIDIAKATGLPLHTVFLMGIGVFSSVACRKWKVNYKHGGSLPIGLYVVAEQPSGTGKSRCLNTFQNPFFMAEKKFKSDHCSIKNELEEERKIPPFFSTNSTPEALEETLSHTKGFFSAVSSEQGLFNTMLGLSYGDGKASNNDLLLNGFDGGYISSMRVKRQGYFGHVAGSAVMFAQSGGIEKLLIQSNGTGLSERFLLIAEKHGLGTRDFNNVHHIDESLLFRYSEICNEFCTGIIQEPKDFEFLNELEISEEGHQLIADYRNSIEEHLADGGRYSHVSLRGAASKIDMQIMKLAANLHLMDDSLGFFKMNTMINVIYIKTAILIANAMIEANRTMCIDKGIIGVKAEYSSILSLFELNSKPRTEREIIQAKNKTIPFKDFTGNKSELIRTTVKGMVEEGILKETFTIDNIKMYSLAQ